MGSLYGSHPFPDHALQYLAFLALFSNIAFDPEKSETLVSGILQHFKQDVKYENSTAFRPYSQL